MSCCSADVWTLQWQQRQLTFQERQQNESSSTWDLYSVNSSDSPPEVNHFRVCMQPQEHHSKLRYSCENDTLTTEITFADGKMFL